MGCWSLGVWYLELIWGFAALVTMVVRMTEHMAQDTKRIKGSLVVVVGMLGAVLIVSLGLNVVLLYQDLVHWDQVGSRSSRAQEVVAQLDAMEREGTLDEFDLKMTHVTGKPRVWRTREIEGVTHQLMIVGSDTEFVELFALMIPDRQEMFEGPVYAAHFVRVGCCGEGEDRWWVSDVGLLEAYVLGE